jgi:hypothetical protein
MNVFADRRCQTLFGGCALLLELDLMKGCIRQCKHPQMPPLSHRHCTDDSTSTRFGL